MSGVRQSLQPKFELNHALPQAHRLQAVRLRFMRPSLPKKSRFEKTQRDTTHGTEAYGTGDTSGHNL